jgi:hypothetical protein
VELVRYGRDPGGDGAVLATADGALRLPALRVPVRGAVGAGDSFLAAMTLALSQGAAAADAFGWGAALRHSASRFASAGWSRGPGGLRGKREATSMGPGLPLSDLMGSPDNSADQLAQFTQPEH